MVWQCFLLSYTQKHHLSSKVLEDQSGKEALRVSFPDAIPLLEGTMNAHYKQNSPLVLNSGVFLSPTMTRHQSLRAATFLAASEGGKTVVNTAHLSHIGPLAGGGRGMILEESPIPGGSSVYHRNKHNG